MNEYSEKRSVNRAMPIGRPIVEQQYDSVVTERQPTSGVAIAALVVAAVAVAVVITIMILNNQQSSRDQEIAQERDRLAATQQQQQPTPQPSQQAPIIVMPPSGAPGQSSVPSQAAPPAEATAPSSIDVEIAVTSKLLDDQELHTYPIDVKVKAGTVTLSGNLPSQELKDRAERVAKTVKGVRDVTNKIIVQP